MNYGVIAAFGVIVILMATMSSTSTHQVFAADYEKSQAISQVNECGNYWFPINIICSNLNSQVQDDENNVVMATAPDSGNTDSDSNYGAPFP
jgi:hypothetical protein